MTALALLECYPTLIGPDMKKPVARRRLKISAAWGIFHDFFVQPTSDHPEVYRNSLHADMTATFDCMTSVVAGFNDCLEKIDFGLYWGRDR